MERSHALSSNFRVVEGNWAATLQIRDSSREMALVIGKPLIVILSLAGLFTAIVALDPGHYFTLDYLQSQYETLMAYRLRHPRVAMPLYFVLHVLVTGLSLPGMIIMSLAGGAVFGLVWGTVLVSFASTIGSTLAFLAARYTLRDVVQRRLG
jgi:uncharacterized membrane protein YdjX (TVP38/TMEM64 family)